MVDLLVAMAVAFGFVMHKLRHRRRSGTQGIELRDRISMEVRQEDGLPPKVKFDIRFDSVGLEIKTRRGTRKVLAGVTGEFLSGQVSLIMGPSGSGRVHLGDLT